MLLVLAWRAMHEKKLLNRAQAICKYSQTQYIDEFRLGEEKEAGNCLLPL